MPGEANWKVAVSLSRMLPAVSVFAGQKPAVKVPPPARTLLYALKRSVPFATAKKLPTVLSFTSVLLTRTAHGDPDCRDSPRAKPTRLEFWPEHALLDHVADEVGLSAIGQVDLAARFADGLVAQAVVLDHVHPGAALQLLSHVGMVAVVEAEDERVDVADVEVVREAVAETVVGEFAVLDQDRARMHLPRKDAVLVIVEIAMAHDEVEPFLPDPGAVLVGH